MCVCVCVCACVCVLWRYRQLFTLPGIVLVLVENIVLAIDESGILQMQGARCSYVVERPLMVQWIDGSIPYGGPTELFLVPASDPRLV